ncbi:glycosyltransferase family 4 protein [Bacillus infantis]|uniref:Glycosyltransferase family 4 protein n=1 Tax=Bacillus infantis TaxID=324767 RepID=A0A5D4R5T6_9BACI|nr:glycosyltransferase family 4 protein [Bacillus infantis]TYS46727.1 glycosyltransferase family 4 protein [Bacillus infantis]
MKILIVSYYPQPSVGGIWTYVSKLVNRLRSLNHEVSILSMNIQTYNYRIHDRIEELTEQSAFSSSEILKAYPDYKPDSFIFQTEVYRYSLYNAAKYYGLEDYDLIYAQDVMSAGVIGRIKPSKVPMVMSAHGYLLGEILFYLKSKFPNASDETLQKTEVYNFFQSLEKLGYHYCDMIHSQSQWMRELIVNGSQVPEEKVVLFPYGVDTSSILETFETSEKLDTGGKKVIIFTGRLVYLKGVNILISALGLLDKERQDWECWILGDGEEKTNLEQQCSNLGITSSVKFFGNVKNVFPYLKSADIFVLPGLQDTQPHSVMEAQLAGLPVIVSDATGLPEMVQHQINGFIFRAHNIEALKMQLHFLLDDEQTRREFGEQSIRWALNNWDYNEMAENILTMFTQAISKSQFGS